jgi:hypothetical protein
MVNAIFTLSLSLNLSAVAECRGDCTGFCQILFYFVTPNDHAMNRIGTVCQTQGALTRPHFC